MRTNLGCPKEHTLLSKRVKPAESTGNEWVLGFTPISLECGKRYHALYVLDFSTRDCLAIEAGLSQSVEGIINALDQLKLERELPARILLDPSSKHFSKELQNWCDEHRVTLVYINNIKPSPGARIEQFHQSFETEFLRASSFLTLDQLRAIASIWRLRYNERTNPN